MQTIQRINQIHKYQQQTENIIPKKEKKNTKVSSRVRKDQCSTNKTHQGYLNQSFLMLNATPPMSSLQLKEIFEAKIDKLKKET